MIEFPFVHNDDLIPINKHNGILISVINYEQQEKRLSEFNKKLIDVNKGENE